MTAISVIEHNAVVSAAPRLLHTTPPPLAMDPVALLRDL